MKIIGYQPATGADAAGHRVHGYRVYGVDRVGGVCGTKPVSFFVSDKGLAALGYTIDQMLDEEFVIRLDVFAQVISIRKVNKLKGAKK